MRIDGSAVTMTSSHLLARSESSRVEIRRTVDPPRPPRADRFEQSTRPEAVSSDPCEPCSEASGVEPRLQVLVGLLERLTGRPVVLRDPHEVLAGFDVDPSVLDAVTTSDLPGRRLGWSMQVDAWHRVEEYERTSVSIGATVTTADGTVRQVSLDLTMERRFVAETTVSIRAGDPPRAKDPLIVTLDPSMARLGDETVRFDLDGDGADDDVRLTAGSSAFLVHDRDGNGGLTDGTELFGTRSGDGFADLGLLDDDGNGWIDEGDAAFDRLGLATGDGEGGTTFRSLREAGVGAISVSGVTSPFSITDPATNELLGQIRSTGLVLREDGGVGTVQHVDLVL